MTNKTKKIQVLVSEAEFMAFKHHAENLDASMSDILRRYVKEIIRNNLLEEQTFCPDSVKD